MNIILNLFIAEKVSKIIYHFLAGFGLLFAGIGGLRIFLDWFSKFREIRKIKNIISKLKEKYPVEELGDTFRLIRSKSNRRPVYLWDIDAKTKQHMATRYTLEILDFRFDMVEELNQEEFDNIKEAKKIEIKNINPLSPLP